MSRSCFSVAPRLCVTATTTTTTLHKLRLGRTLLCPHEHVRAHVLRASKPPCRWYSPSGSGSGSGSGSRDKTRERGSLLTLAIESSCDDTSVAVLEKLPSGAARLYFNKKITSDSRAFGGVHPLTAVVSHTEHLAPLVRDALRALPETHHAGDKDVLWVDGAPRAKPDFVSVTRGPGMLSNLSTGLNTAKGLAVAWDVPLLAVNHMQAHALTPRLVSALEKGRESDDNNSNHNEDNIATGKKQEENKERGREEAAAPAFPFLSLLVSGGHSMLLRSRALNDHAILAKAMNIAIGDMLDKCARLIVPAEMLHGGGDNEGGATSTTTTMYAPALEKFAFPPVAGESDDHDYDYSYTPPAKRADEIRPFDSGLGWTLTPPLAGMGPAMAFDFAGINGQVQRAVQDRGGADAMPLAERRLLARETMRVVFEHLATRVLFALDGSGRAARLKPRRGTATATANQEHEGKEKEKERGVEITTREVTDDDDNKNEEIRTLVLAGGVASNRYLRHVVRAVLDARGHAGVRLACPPPALCTDNAAMVAWAAAEMYEAGWRSALDVLAIRRWGLDPAGEDGGILGARGWVRAATGAGDV